MTEPKVSERMEKTVAIAVEAAYRRGLFERGATSDPALEEKDTKATSALLSAIAEIEQRAGEIYFFASIVRDHYADIVMPTVEYRSAAKPFDWINCAIFELGNQHKRAEKWERLARAAVKATVFYPDVNDKARIMIEMEQAIAALGDEWDEAVR